jgi:hypothetical protein
MNRFLLIVSLSVVAMAGCYTEADVGYGYAAPAPAMVAVEGAPGVTVIADYDYPVFFYGGAYWRYDGGIWYSSRWYNRGWAVNYGVPGVVARIDSPHLYAHYRGGPVYRGGVGYRGGYRGAATPVYRGAAQPAVRDHRTYSAPAARPAPVSRPVVRDHRR